MAKPWNLMPQNGAKSSKPFRLERLSCQGRSFSTGFSTELLKSYTSGVIPKYGWRPLVPEALTS